MFTQRFAFTALAAVICHGAYAQSSSNANVPANANANANAIATTPAPNSSSTPMPTEAGVPAGKVSTPFPMRLDSQPGTPVSASGQAPKVLLQPSEKAPATAAGQALGAGSKPQSGPVMAGADPVAPADGAGPAIAAAPATALPDYETGADGVRILRGNDRVIAPPRSIVKAEGPASTFKFEEAPISEVVHVMLGEILKVDYVLHQPVTGSVTLATRGNVSPDQAVFLLESALQVNGIVMARDARGTYHVGRPEALKGIVSPPRLVGNTTLPPGSGAVIVPLRYIGAAEMATIMRSMVPPDAILRVDSLRNLLVLGGTRVQAEGWLELINTFDVDLLKGMSVGIFPLKYATVREVEAALALMAGGGASAPAAASARPGAPGGTAAASGGAAPAQANGSPFFGAVRIMPIERISSILVVSPLASNLDEARKWIERFDRPSDNNSEAQLFVYPVQNGSAKHLATVLSSVFGGGAGQSGTGGTGVAPGLGSNTASTPGFGNQLGSSGFSSAGGSTFGLGGASANRGNAGLGGQGNQPGVTSATLGQSGVRIIADEVNNAILIYGTRSEYAKIESTLRRLDIRSAQVLIEATLIEVTLKDELAYGLQWAFNDSRRNADYTGKGVLSSIGGGVLGPALKGFSYTLSNAAGDVRAVLNALADKSLVKMLSSPTLMVLDNQTASIVVGNQQPIKSGETVATTGTAISTSIQYKDTGVSLAFTPSVNAGNIVTMVIKQSVTDVGDKDDATGQRAFLQRQLESKVAIRSGETLVLGGLIRDNTTVTKSGIPLLQDIPVLGAAFRNTGSLTNRTELLVILTPRVVRSDEDARELTDEVRTRMKSFSTIDRLDPRYSTPAPRVESNGIYAPPFNKGVITP